MNNIAQALANVRESMHVAGQKYGRKGDSVQLLAVSKARHPVELEQALAAGQRDFGENYLQEALPKIHALGQPGLVWHYIGPIQSNKTRDIAAHFHWVHSIDRLKTAKRLSAARPEKLPPLNCCIQVNTSGELSKSGVAEAQLSELAEAVADLPGLRLRGLMTMPAPETDVEKQRPPFRRLHRLLQGLIDSGHQLDTLSMGTSADMEAAIAEGSTMVRIGTAIFGPRA